MNISRRYFLKNGGIAMLGMAALPSFLQRAVAATRRAEQEENGRALSARRDGRPERRRAVRRAELLPHAPDHRDSRSRAAAAPMLRIDLDGFFGLHPSLAAAACRSFSNGQLAIVHAVGSPDPTRSHFDAQDFMESGTPGVKATDDGWLNRALQSMPEEQAVAISRRGLRSVSAAHACRAARRPSPFPI